MRLAFTFGTCLTGLLQHHLHLNESRRHPPSIACRQAREVIWRLSGGPASWRNLQVDLHNTLPFAFSPLCGMCIRLLCYNARECSRMQYGGAPVWTACGTECDEWASYQG